MALKNFWEQQGVPLWDKETLDGGHELSNDGKTIKRGTKATANWGSSYGGHKINFGNFFAEFESKIKNNLVYSVFRKLTR